jgi:hypothetical protein
MNQRTLSSGILVADLLWSPLALAGALVLHYGIAVSENAAYLPTTLPFLAVSWVVWTFLFRFLSLEGFAGAGDYPRLFHSCSYLYPD